MGSNTDIVQEERDDGEFDAEQHGGDMLITLSYTVRIPMDALIAQAEKALQVEMTNAPSGLEITSDVEIELRP